MPKSIKKSNQHKASKVAESGRHSGAEGHKSSSRTHSGGPSKAALLDEQRRDKALQKLCDRQLSSQVTGRTDPPMPVTSRPPSEHISLKDFPAPIEEVSLWHATAVPTGNPVQTQAPLDSIPHVPLAPTVPAPPPGLDPAVSNYLQQMFSTFMQQTGPSANNMGLSPAPLGASSDILDIHSVHGSASNDSFSDAEEVTGLSDDDSAPADAPASTSLFPSALFKSLLAKAIATTGFAAPEPPSTSTTANPAQSSLFKVQSAPADIIPTPDIFLDTVRGQWSALGSAPVQSQVDKKLYNVGSEMTKLLQLPSVDPPIQALWSRSAVPGDPEEGLKPEDKRSEHFLQRSHGATEWAIRSSMAASFFGRATLLWLKELRAKLPPGDATTQHDVNKIVAAVQYMADATLTSTRYSAKSLSSTVGASRMLWLKSWQVDARRKYRLATSPYTGQNLFGEALDPLLIENKDKKKIMPSVSRKGDFRPNYTSRRNSFKGSDWGAGPSRAPSWFAPKFRPYYDRTGSYDRSGNYDRSSNYDKPARGRNSNSKRPFRGGGGRPFRRQR